MTVELKDAKYVSCSHELYGGDIKAGHWYEITNKDENLFYFFDSSGDVILAGYPESHHLKDDARWILK